ncbi:MAG: amylo-alpha-1,6-glucosidase [Blastocatellales bacterium]
MRKLARSIITALLIAALSQSPGAGPPTQQARQPEAPRALVGAYDSAQLNGVVFITNDQNVFGLRFLTYRPGVAVEDSPRSFEFGPSAPDGSYAQLSWRSRFDDKTLVTLQWSRVSDNMVVGRLSAPANTRVAIEAYRPWSDARSDLGWATFSAQEDRRTIFGEQVNSQKTKPPLRNFLLRADRAATGASDYSDSLTMRKTLVREGHAQQTSPAQEDREVSRFAVLSFDPIPSSVTGFTGAPNSANSVGFVAMIGDDFNAMEAKSDKLLQRTVAETLDQQEKKHEDSRVTSGGSFGASFTIFSSALNWSRAYLPERRMEYLAVSRRNDHDARNAVLSWDTFFNAAFSALVADALASATIRLLLEGQAPDGRAPLRRYLQNPRRDEAAVTTGRSMPPIGALCVWKVYLTTHDLGLLAWAYPRLRQWNDWWFSNRGDGQAWRDGNGDGLLELGFDAELEQGQLGARTLSNAAKQKLAFSESGLEDRPQWLNGHASAPGAANSNQPDPKSDSGDEARYNDKSHTIEYSTVGLNALYALDTEILMMMARELGLPAESDKWQIRYEQIRKNINEKLWSEEDGLYLNRHWDGRFSRRLSPENFYPLVAGLADEEKAKRMVATLLDPKKFWGEYPLPSISRDDAAFAEKTTGRGAIWAPMNYLIYLGLKRYEYHDEAAELARKNLSIARTALEKSGRFYDQYSSFDGRPVSEKSDEEGDGPRTYFFGLMLWPAVEELISADLWTGLSFGSVGATEESRLERISFSGVKFDVIAGPKRTVIRRNGKIELDCEAPVRLRAYRTGDRAIGFAIEAKERTHVLVPASEGRKITVSVNDKVLGSTSAGAAASFKVSAGINKVLIVK